MKTAAKDEIRTTAACFRQRVTLPTAQVAGLKDAELATALCFEIEPFSGIPAASGELAWKMLPGSDAAHAIFDVVQIRKTDLANELAQARAEKKRIQYVTAVPAEGEGVESLPKIPARVKRDARLRPWIVWMLFCVCALGALAYETWTVCAEKNELQRQVAARRSLQAEKTALTRQIDAVRQETESIRKRRMDEARAQQNVEALRAAWPKLLEAVPKACRNESVVQRVQATGAYAAQISGVSLSADAATRTFVRLTEALQAPASGWRVKPGAIGAATGGGTVTFSCEVVFDEEGQFK